MKHDSEKNDPRPHPAQLPGPSKNGHPMTSEEFQETGVEIISRCAARAGVTFEQAATVLQAADAELGANDVDSEAITEALRRRDEQWVLWVGKIFSMLDVYTSQQNGRKFVRMSIVTMMYVLGYDVEAGVRSFAEIARKLKLARKQSGKQTVTKCAAHFLDQLKLAPMLTQRTEAARQEMARARQERVKRATNGHG